jgi:hypothetical protein
MLKKAADYSVRIALFVSMTAYGVAPATAALPQTALPGKSDDAASGIDLSEIDALFAAFRQEPSRQSVDHPRQPESKPRESQVKEHGRREVEVKLSKYTTHEIVQDLNSIRRECSGHDEAYRIDCLRQGIDMVVAKLPDNSEYREAKRIMKTTSSRLGRIVSNYRDPEVPKLEVPTNANPRFKKRRKYSAIRRQTASEAMAKAQDVVNEATTELLRSGENSERRYAHYQDISVAVDSTKTLLRSS